LYICTETVSTFKFFEVGDKVSRDCRLQPNTNVIIDFQLAELDILASDLRFVIEKMKETQQKGREIRTAILTKSTSLRFLGDAIKIMSAESPFDFSIFNTEKDAVRWLGLPEDKTMQFWVETRKSALKQYSPKLEAYPYTMKSHQGLPELQTKRTE
jgi:hypothetical protein